MASLRETPSCGGDAMLRNGTCHGKGWRLILIKGSSSTVKPTKSTYIYMYGSGTPKHSVAMS